MKLNDHSFNIWNFLFLFIMLILLYRYQEISWYFIQLIMKNANGRRKNDQKNR